MDQSSVLALASLSKDIAQLNLGYLGISVAILGALGGVFVYFNLNPLKENLSKQEKKIEDLKAEAHSLLDESKVQSEKTLEDFAISQFDKTSLLLKQQKNEIDLETKNKIQDSHSLLSDKIENISESKDLKLKEIILSESNNNLAILDKNLTLKISTTKEDVLKEIKLVNAGINAKIKELSEKVIELQVYKYSKEGQMGAIIYSIELLENAIEDYFKTKKELVNKLENSSDDKTFGWKVNYRLEGLIKEIGDSKLEEDEVKKILIQISKIENESVFKVLAGELKKKVLYKN
ncbi:MAG: hypothetical protein WC817_03000 [Patescibacteria group bacterium]|jgi:hypothetical protein